MNSKIGIITLLFGIASFGLAIAGQAVPAGVFGLCAGALGYLTGRMNNGD